jgi:hypothetical protein
MRLRRNMSTVAVLSSYVSELSPLYDTAVGTVLSSFYQLVAQVIVSCCRDAQRACDIYVYLSVSSWHAVE